MKAFTDFFEVDEFFFRLFSKENNIFSRLVYKGEPVGIALQHNLYDYYKSFVFAAKAKASVVQRIQSQIRIYGSDHRVKFFLNRFIGAGHTLLPEEKIVFFADNYIPRILDDFRKLIAEINPDSVAFYTTDYRSYRYMVKKRCHLHYPIVLLGDRSKSRKNAQHKKKLIADFEQHIEPLLGSEFGDLKPAMSKIIKSNLNVLADYYDLFDQCLEQSKPAKIIMGSDGFSIARIMCLAAAKAKTPTFVLQHGLIDSFNGYLPLIASNIFLWSDYEKKIFVEKGTASHRLIVSGSPRFDYKKPGRANAGLIKSNQLLFVISPGVPQDVCDQIDAALNINDGLTIHYDILIRPHPYYKNLAKAHFEKLPRAKNVILDNQPFHKSVTESGLVVFGNISTGVFEALRLDKNIYVLANTVQSKLEIYNFPKIEIHALLNGLNNGIKDIKEFNLLGSSSARSASFMYINSSAVIAGHLSSPFKVLASYDVASV